MVSKVAKIDQLRLGAAAQRHRLPCHDGSYPYFIYVYGMKRFFLLSGLLLPSFFGMAQSVQLLSEGTKASFRGLSVVDDRIVWVSGSNGTVGLSTDGGKQWQFSRVPGFEKTDFRDIEAFDESRAVIMGIDSPAFILKTQDGGKSWQKVFEDHSRGIFLDAMDFESNGRGMAIGDPMDGHFLMLCSWDSGSTWKKVKSDKSPPAREGEACFSSSGSNIVSREPGGEMLVISGGMESRLFFKRETVSLPLAKGRSSAGANSIAVKNKDCFMIVGGDFEMRDSTRGNCIFTDDGGKTWIIPDEPPHGYRSSVSYLGKKNWITCGLNGVDLSRDNGRTFRSISSTGFHVCRKAKKGRAVYLAGGGGRVGKLLTR